VKLCIFDFDSTLMNGETIDFFAAELGIEEQVAQITDRAMRGELDFFASLQERAKLLEGLEVKKVEQISRSLPLMCGAVESVRALKSRGLKVICFSGGFRTATSHAAQILGLDADFANTLYAVDGRLTGAVGGEMMFADSKGQMLTRLQSILGITEDETMVVGDGANDLSMFKHASTRVAFCAKEILKKEANIVIENRDLREIIDKIR